MICTHCGQFVDDGAAYCGNCGTPAAPTAAAQTTGSQPGTPPAPVAPAAQSTPPTPMPQAPGAGQPPVPVSPSQPISQPVAAAPQPVPQPAPAGAMPMVPAVPTLNQRGSGRAIASLVLGLVALPGCLLIFPGFIIGLVGLILGTTALHSRHRGMAIAGIVLSALAVLLSVFLLVWSAENYANKQTLDTTCYSGQIPQAFSDVQKSDPCKIVASTPGHTMQFSIEADTAPLGLNSGNFDGVMHEAAQADQEKNSAQIISEGPATFAGKQAYKVLFRLPQNHNEEDEVYYIMTDKPYVIGANDYSLFYVTFATIDTNQLTLMDDLEKSWQWK